jgi:hypothetical protein
MGQDALVCPCLGSAWLFGNWHTSYCTDLPINPNIYCPYPRVMAGETPGKSFRNIVLLGVGCAAYCMGVVSFIILVVIWALLTHGKISIT